MLFDRTCDELCFRPVTGLLRELELDSGLQAREEALVLGDDLAGGLQDGLRATVRRGKHRA